MYRDCVEGNHYFRTLKTDNRTSRTGPGKWLKSGSQASDEKLSIATAYKSYTSYLRRPSPCSKVPELENTPKSFIKFLPGQKGAKKIDRGFFVRGLKILHKNPTWTRGTPKTDRGFLTRGLKTLQKKTTGTKGGGASQIGDSAPRGPEILHNKTTN